MEEILQRVVDGNFSELTGLTVHASIPLPEKLVNEFVQSAVQGNKNLTDCYVAIHMGNRIVVNLKTPLWPWPLNLKLKLEPFVDFTAGAKIKASLENFALLGKLGAVFKAFPQGVTMHDDLITIDIPSFLKTIEQRKWLQLIKSMEISTEEAKMTIDIDIAVE
jgi:hypothetical protein